MGFAGLTQSVRDPGLLGQKQAVGERDETLSLWNLKQTRMSEGAKSQLFPVNVRCGKSYLQTATKSTPHVLPLFWILLQLYPRFLSSHFFQGQKHRTGAPTGTCNSCLKGVHSEECLVKYHHDDHDYKVKKTQQNKNNKSLSLNLLRQTIVAHTEAVKSVLKAKPQSAVVDADHSIDFNPWDAVNLKVWWMEAGQQEIATGREPVRDITNTPSGGSCVSANVLVNKSQVGHQRSARHPSSKRIFPTLSSSISRNWAV